MAALLDLLDLDAVSLNGESLGGWVSMKFAYAHPDRTRRIVLNAPGGTVARPEVMQRLRMLSQQAAYEPTAERIRTRLEWLVADNTTVTDELVEARRQIYSRRVLGAWHDGAERRRARRSRPCFPLRAGLDPDNHWLQSHSGLCFIQCTTRIR